mgnify:CR=1 FL=1
MLTRTRKEKRIFFWKLPQLPNLEAATRGAAMNTDEYYCGVLDYSQRRMIDGRDVSDLIQELRTVSHRNPDNVRQLNLSRCCLDLMRPYDNSSLATSVACFTWLSVVRINTSGLHGQHMIALLYPLLRLPFMQGRNPVGDAKAEAAYPAEISLQNNQITDETVRLLSEVEGCFLRSSPASGVKKLDLSYNSVTDKAVRMMARLTPRLTHLYLTGNSDFTGTHLESHVTKFSPLSVLGMDKTGVDAQGVANLLAGLCKRKASDQCPVELWMRGMVHQPMDSWCPLLNFCGAKVDTQNKFRATIKHDLQNGLGHYSAGAMSQHDVVTAKLFLNGWQPVEVRHFDVPADMPISRLAALAVNEVTAVCLEDMTRPANTTARALRLRYCAALKHVIEGGTMVMKVFKVETARAVYVHRFSGEKVVVDGMGIEVCGAPKPGWDVAVEVAVDEDTDMLTRLSKAPRR